MSNALDPAALDIDADRPFRPNLRRRAKDDLIKLVAHKVGFCIRIQDKVVFALLNAQLQTLKDLSRFQVATEAEIIDMKNVIAKLIERHDEGGTIEIEECLVFMNKVTKLSHRQELIERVCTLTTHKVHKQGKSARDTRGLSRKIEAVDAYARRVANEKDDAALAKLVEPTMVITKLKELLPGV